MRHRCVAGGPGVTLGRVSDPWDTEHLDLDAYLARVGVPAQPPSRAAFNALHEAHVRTFTFDNIDVLNM